MDHSRGSAVEDDVEQALALLPSNASPTSSPLPLTASPVSARDVEIAEKVDGQLAAERRVRVRAELLRLDRGEQRRGRVERLLAGVLGEDLQTTVNWQSTGALDSGFKDFTVP